MLLLKRFAPDNDLAPFPKQALSRSLAFLACFLSLFVDTLGQETFLMGLLAPWNASFDSFSALTSASAVSLAVEKIQADPTLNNSIRLEVMTLDTACSSKKAAGNAVRMHIEYNVDVFIGPPCSIACRPVAELASFWDKPIISWVATDPDFTDSTIYSTLARTLGPLNKMGVFLLQFLKESGWNRVAIISSDFLLWKDASKALRKVFSTSNLTISYSATYDNRPTDAFIDRSLRKIKLEARVVVVICPMAERREIMLKAYDLGMTDGEYVFITMDVTPTDDITSVAEVWRGQDERDWAARRAFESVFHVVLAALTNTEVNVFRKEVARRMRLPPWSQYISEWIDLNKRMGSYTNGDKYSPFLHDAVYLYAIALNETLAKGDNPRSGEALAKNMKWKRFIGKTGSIILDGNADREPDYWIMDMAANGTFVKIAELVNRETNIGLDIKGRIYRHGLVEPRWPGGAVGWNNAPKDTPRCGFLHDRCKDEEVQDWAIALSVLVPLIALAAGVAISIFTYRKVRFETSLSEQMWRVSWEDIEPLKAVRSKDGSSSTVSHSNGSGVAKFPGSTAASRDLMQSVPSVGTGAGQLFSRVGMYRGAIVSIKAVNMEHIQVSRDLMMEFNDMKDIAHENLNIFIGACIDPPNLCLIWHYCNKGSLQDVLENDAVKLDTAFKFSFMSDMAKGMLYMHSSNLQSHGNLKSANCLIDARWTLKISDYGLPTFLLVKDSGLNEHEVFKTDDKKYQDESIQFRRKLWTAPEILRENVPKRKGTQKGDVYSFAIICYEIIERSEPYTFDNVTPRDIVNRVRNGESIPYRPPLSDSCEMGKPLVHLIRKCWSEDTEERPSFLTIRSQLRRMTKGEINIIDNVLNMMEKYAYNLEEIVEERTQQLVEEKKKTDRLLYRMLPTTVADALKLGEFVKPENYDQATIYFSDIVGFTNIAADSSPMQIVDFLNDLYSCFDEIIERHDVYKVETIGDAYMVVSGVPVRNGNRHSAEVANCALDLLSSVTHFKIRHRPKTQLALRIGLHTGPCVAGVVGNIMPRYCLFGDAVNMAARMESSGKPLGIHVSKQTYTALKEHGDYNLVLRGEVNVKGKGLLTTYWLQGKSGYSQDLPKFDSDGIKKQLTMGSDSSKGLDAERPNGSEGMPTVV